MIVCSFISIWIYDYTFFHLNRVNVFGGSETFLEIFSFIYFVAWHAYFLRAFLLTLCSWLVNVCGFKNRGAKLSPVPCYLLIIKDKANAWTVDNTTKGEKSDTVVPSTGKLETFLGCAMLRQPHQLVILFVYYVTIFCQKPS